MEKASILLVEDDRTLLNNYKEILELEGFDVIAKPNGLEALEFCKKNKVDLILSDITMPDMDGYDFFTQFKQLKYVDTPFLFLTSKTEYVDLRYAMNLGSDDYLAKPISTKDLVQSVKVRLHRKLEISENFHAIINRLEKGFELMSNHEFLTPLNGIIGFLNILKKNLSNADSEENLKFINYINQSAKRLLELLEKLRLWNSINNEQTEITDTAKTNVSLVMLLQYWVNEIAGSYDRLTDVMFYPHEDMIVEIDPYFIGIIFKEVTDNAFKFSSKGSPVVLETKIQNGKYLVIISDSGQNCKAQFIRESQVFFQFNRNKFEQQGLGIGLAITNLICHKTGTEIEFLDNEPKGITVIIKLDFVETQFH